MKRDWRDVQLFVAVYVFVLLSFIWGSCLGSGAPLYVPLTMTAFATALTGIILWYIWPRSWYA